MSRVSISRIRLNRGMATIVVYSHACLLTSSGRTASSFSIRITLINVGKSIMKNCAIDDSDSQAAVATATLSNTLAAQAAVATSNNTLAEALRRWQHKQRSHSKRYWMASSIHRLFPFQDLDTSRTKTSEEEENDLSASEDPPTEEKEQPEDAGNKRAAVLSPAADVVKERRQEATGFLEILSILHQHG
ncbi:hypothetical protein ACHAW5_002126 [Stephanodiscus triporus]|uniref:Uncharacterized protein n=1 Tax=Stephanodiscus triporus TaxID=2934178 RepID=A0ABD3P6W0_9STRA